MRNPSETATDAHAGAVPVSIFRAYDIRGLVGDTLTAGGVYQIGRAIGSQVRDLDRRSVVVGWDTRLSSEGFAKALAEGLRATGCHVVDIGLVTTPVMYFATHVLSTDSGVMVTASHNPPEYNGLKVVVGGEALHGQGIQQLRQRIEQGALLRGEGSVESWDPLPTYLERILSDVSLVRRLKLVIDCGHGTAGLIAPELFRSLGCDLTTLDCDAGRPGEDRFLDPSQPANLQPLCAAVVASGADLGLAFDGDADRLGVVDSEGVVVWSDRVLMLFATDLLSRKPGAQVIYDVKCTHYLARLIREQGGHPIMWKSGHSLLKAKLNQTGALLAGEWSGHFMFQERWYGFDDGLYAAGRLLEILALDGRPSAEVFAEFPKGLGTPELSVTLGEGEPQVAMAAVLDCASLLTGAELTTLDGLRADFPMGWGLVRASNTTPALIFRFEAEDRAALDSIQAAFRRLMHQAAPNLVLPF